ncbi:MAG: T9SS type A sorting domain-containing protein [Bacteroidetes bacterium]|nr:T9SS type A sorting domain-containing protein [Bacteroidota bacterium]
MFLTVFYLFIFFSFYTVQPSFAQPFAKQVILSFHTCDASCTGFQDHQVNLAESDDGITWTPVPNFSPYQGSVPDVIIHGSKLYIYTPGKVNRYDNSSGSWDVNPVAVSITDSAGNFVSYVDPSAVIDSTGRIVLFFLNSTGSTGDPAGCSTYPCTKYFDSAVEVDGSDGTQFTLLDGHRKEITLNNSPQTASDPDIYFDGNEYILYISQGSSSLAFHSTSMHGVYSSFPNLTNDLLTNQGGIPCGFFNEDSWEYHTYVHSNVSGNTVIGHATHTGFTGQLNTFTTVISGPIIGEPATTKTESPGICRNEFIVGINPSEKPEPKLPVVRNGRKWLFYSPVNGISRIEIFDVMGRKLPNYPSVNSQFEIIRDGLNAGIYFYKLYSDKNLIHTGKIIVE